MALKGCVCSSDGVALDLDLVSPGVVALAAQFTVWGRYLGQRQNQTTASRDRCEFILGGGGGGRELWERVKCWKKAGRRAHRLLKMSD